MQFDWVCFRVVERMSRCDVWLLLLLAHRGTATGLTDSTISKLNMQVFGIPCVRQILAHRISLSYFLLTPVVPLGNFQLT